MNILVENKKARFNYEILETYKAGIELLGFEVKALKEHKGSLEGSYIIVRGAEAYVVNFFIPPYQPGNTPLSYNPYRNRRLLLTKKEIAELAEKENAKGLTIVPILVYNIKNRVKIEIAITRGKKKYDKRETIKKRDTERDMRRTLKNE